MALLNLNQLGGLLFEQSCASHALSSNDDVHPQAEALDKVFQAIDRLEAESTSLVGAENNTEGDIENDVACSPDGANLGNNVHQLLQKDKDFQWERMNRSLSIGRIKLDDPNREVALHKLEPGGRVGNHDHKGKEITVVLVGSFSDQDGLYLPGDFLVREPGEAHQPVASIDASCVCLSVLEAPVKFTGFSRLINPFLRLKPRAA